MAQTAITKAFAAFVKVLGCTKEQLIPPGYLIGDDFNSCTDRGIWGYPGSRIYKQLKWRRMTVPTSGIWEVLEIRSAELRGVGRRMGSGANWIRPRGSARPLSTG